METLKNNKTKSYFILGLALLTIGLLSLVDNLGVMMPFWVFNWSTILLAIGLLLGYRRDFKAGGWIILVFIGGLNFLQNILAVALTPYMLALFCIGLGIYLLTNSGKKDQSSCGYGKDEQR